MNLMTPQFTFPMQNYRRLLPIILFGVTTTVAAQNSESSEPVAPAESKPLRTLEYRYGFNSDNAYQNRIDGLYSVNNALSFQGMLGNAYYPDPDYELTTRTASLGVDYKPQPKLLLGFQVKYWGDPGDIAVKRAEGRVSLRFNNWRVALYPDYRTIEVIPQLTRIGNRTLPSTLDVTSTGIGGLIEYSGDENGYVSAEAHWYDYDRDVSRLSSAPRLVAIIFSPLSRDFVLGFEDRSAAIEAGYDFERFTVSARWDYAVSAVDSAEYGAFSLLGRIMLGDKWDLILSTGASDGTASDSVTFGSVGLGYYF